MAAPANIVNAAAVNASLDVEVLKNFRGSMTDSQKFSVSSLQRLSPQVQQFIRPSLTALSTTPLPALVTSRATR